VRLLEGKCGGATIGVEYENTDAQRGRGRFGIYTFSIPFPTEAARLISDRLVGRVMAFVTKKSTLRPPRFPTLHITRSPTLLPLVDGQSCVKLKKERVTPCPLASLTALSLACVFLFFFLGKLAQKNKSLAAFSENTGIALLPQTENSR